MKLVTLCFRIQMYFYYLLYHYAKANIEVLRSEEFAHKQTGKIQNIAACKIFQTMRTCWKNEDI